MNQVVQNIRTGELNVAAIPDPIVKPGHVLIANSCSLISAGTEKMAMDLAKKSLLGKARERPDHVRRVIEKMRQEGILNTLSKVSQKLDEPMKLGYSSAGVVLACGAGVQMFKPGDRVASNGCHAGIVCVPHHLCAHVPENVPFDHAAFSVLGAIALQGIRLAQVGLGDTAFVIGLGLVGQLTVALLKAQGTKVIGTDPDASKCELAIKMGADNAAPSVGAKDVENLTRGLGADAVLITAATKSNEPVELAGEAVRKKGRVVSVGAVGLNLPRQTYFQKEAEFVVSCSYGPGRYDPDYEERGHDYPAPYVRWTEQRNLQAVLDLMGSGRLDVAPLISHHFSIEDAKKAYEIINAGSEPYLGLVLEYPEIEKTTQTIELRSEPVAGEIGIGCIGAGNFARSVLLPAIRRVQAFRPMILCSAGGLTAKDSGEKHGFEKATSDEQAVLTDESVNAVFIMTRHDAHAEQVISALKSGKNVFVEKPLALTIEQLTQIESSLQPSTINHQPSLLMVGFNRRFSPAATEVSNFFSGTKTPLTVSIRFNAGEIPAAHWTQDEKVGGGRIIGEACHAIDLATFLTGSVPVRVFAESISGPETGSVADDQAFIMLRHANGSVSSIAYLSGGDRAFPKERVEVFGAGKVAVIDDFRAVTTVENGHSKRGKLVSQDKGHAGELQAFADALKKGGPAPISWAELRAVSLASILAVRSMREGIPFDIA